MRHLVLSLVMTAAASCTANVRDRELSGIDLSDRRAVAEFGQHLSERERGALMTYALLHWPGSKSFCGRPLGHFRQPPRTVGQAIALTMEFDAALEAARLARAPESPVELAAERDRMLIDQLEDLTLKRQMAVSAPDGAESQATRLAGIDREIADIKRRRVDLARSGLPVEQHPQGPSTPMARAVENQARPVSPGFRPSARRLAAQFGKGRSQ